MFHGQDPFHVQLTVWVLRKGDDESGWRVCTHIGPELGEELIQRHGDVRAVLGAQGRLVSMLLTRGGYPHDAFRILARRTDSQALAGMTEWRASRETGTLLLCDGMPWSASDSLKLTA